MNFSTFKTRLLLNVGNLKSNHPMVSNTNGGGDFINEAMRYTILRASQKYPNFGLFPEHKDVEWTDITIVNQDYMTLPSDQIAVQRVFSLDSSTAPNLNNSNWRPMGWIDPASFDNLTKPTTQNAYPTTWTVREGRVYINPTPRTGFTTYIKLDGIQDEPDMSSGTDSPRTNVRWHPAILDVATYLMKNALNHDDAPNWLKAADEKIETVGASLAGLRKANIKRTVKVAGAPRGAF